MLDTLTEVEGVSQDTAIRLRLTKAAVERAKHKLGLRDYDDVAEAMGFSRSTFYRLLAGTHDIKLGKAVAVSEQIDWPLAKVFERVTRD